MKRANKIFAAALALVMIFSVLTACSPKNTPSGNTDNSLPSSAQGNEIPASPATENSIGSNEAQNQEPEPEDDRIHVGSIKELIDAIKPGADIVIKKGTYDIYSELGKITENIGPYVEIIGQYDGGELVIKGVDGLKISGETSSYADTQLLTSPRYASVLVLKDCKNVELSNLTLGHTNGAECYGNVLSLVNSNDTVLSGLDIYGCGVYGISIDGSTKGLNASSCVIRDCSSGALMVYPDATGGVMEFEDCTFTGSNWGGFAWSSLTCEIYMRNCTFGDMESQYFYFCDDMYFENCKFEEIHQYPEYGPWAPVFSPELFEEAPVDIDLLTASSWMAYAMVPTEEDFENLWEYRINWDMEEGRLLRKAFEFQYDYHGNIYTRSWDNPEEFTWDIGQSGDMFIRTEDGSEHPVRFYHLPGESVQEEQTWVSIEFGEYTIWMCLILTEI